LTNHYVGLITGPKFFQGRVSKTGGNIMATKKKAAKKAAKKKR